MFQIDIDKLSNLLVVSGRVTHFIARRNLCRMIGIKPDDIPFLETSAPNDFATTLISDLVDKKRVTTLLMLCIVIQFNLEKKDLPDLKSIIKQIWGFLKFDPQTVKGQIAFEYLKALQKKYKLLKKLLVVEPDRDVTFKSVALASIGVTSLVTVIRFFGILLPLEFYAYDTFMKLRWGELIDPNILIVEITDKDIPDPKDPITDKKFLELLKALEKLQPQVTGINILRDTAEPKNDQKSHEDLVAYLKGNNNIIASCSTPFEENELQLGSPPPWKDMQEIGFSNVAFDGDSTSSPVRRQILMRESGNNQACNARNSLSYQIASFYLKHQSVNIEPDQKTGYLRMNKGKNNIIIYTLESLDIGAYIGKNLWNIQGVTSDKGEGDQILINYRAAQFKKTTVSDVINLSKEKLQNEFGSNLIVLIGYATEDKKVPIVTPVNSKMPVVELQAHMVSQLVDAMISNRPLLKPLLFIEEILYMCIWSLICGFLVRPIKFQQIIFFIGKRTIPLGILCFVFCYVLFLGGNWLPLIPFLLILELTPAVTRFIEVKTKLKLRNFN